MKISTALETALNALAVDRNDISHLEWRHETGLLYLSFCSSWLYYEVYVDAYGTVPGINTEPLAEREKY